MPPSKTSFVTLCQQLLALGVVIAALTPAASIVSLDVVSEAPSGAAPGRSAAAGGAPAADLAAYSRAAARPSTVPAQVVDPTVDEFALTPPAGTSARGRAGALGGVSARTKAGMLGGSEVTSVPEAVVGYGAVG